MIVHVTQPIGPECEDVELAVTLDGDGGIEGVERVYTDDNTPCFPPGVSVLYMPLPREMGRRLDWTDLNDAVREATRTQLGV